MIPRGPLLPQLAPFGSICSDGPTIHGIAGVLHPKHLKEKMKNSPMIYGSMALPV